MSAIEGSMKRFCSSSVSLPSKAALLASGCCETLLGIVSCSSCDARTRQGQQWAQA